MVTPPRLASSVDVIGTTNGKPLFRPVPEKSLLGRLTLRLREDRTSPYASNAYCPEEPSGPPPPPLPLVARTAQSVAGPPRVDGRDVHDRPGLLRGQCRSPLPPVRAARR